MKRTGFTLIELSAVIGIVTLVAATLAPGIKSTRMKAQARGSESNLMQIGQGSDMYALDNEGRIFTYTWRAGVDYLMPDGKTRRGSDAPSAASWQNTEILMRRTGRIDGPNGFKNHSSRLVHTRLRHIVLMDYLGSPFPDALFADPADANLLQWQANPTDISAANNIPYAPGSDYQGDPGAWTDIGVRQRWAFGSSYQSTVSAWAPDGRSNEATYTPVPNTPHLFMITGSGTIPLPEGRNYLEVTFPSAKVHLFEEFDREQAGSPYFAYDHALPAKLMFDGSVNGWASGEAHASWNPSEPKRAWVQVYVPLHTFPMPLSGLGETVQISQRYRWTLSGLKGVDYPQPLMGR